MKSLSNSVTKFCDKEFVRDFIFSSLIFLPNFAFPSSVCVCVLANWCKLTNML